MEGLSHPPGIVRLSEEDSALYVIAWSLLLQGKADCAHCHVILGVGEVPPVAGNDHFIVQIVGVQIPGLHAAVDGQLASLLGH